MTAKNATPTFNPQIHREACEWFVEFRAGEPGERARNEFKSWLKASPAHLAAYLETAATWNQSAAPDIARRYTKEELIAEALRYPEILAHPTVGLDATPRVSTARRWVRFAARPRVVFAAASVLGLGIAVLFLGFHRAPEYATSIGEQRSIALADGSTVSLNSRSRVRIRYSARERDVELLEGQALFGVAHDTTRPFIVTADNVRVRAVGTEFDVYRKPGETIVTVVEGRVSVITPEMPSPETSTLSGTSPRIFRDQLAQSLSAGEQLSVSLRAVSHPVPVNVASATAWTQRRLVFASTPLREVAAEFNRYNERTLVVGDPEIGAFEIDGVFSSTDPAALVKFLRERPDVQVTENDREIIIARRR